MLKYLIGTLAILAIVVYIIFAIGITIELLHGPKTWAEENAY